MGCGTRSVINSKQVMCFSALICAIPNSMGTSWLLNSPASSTHMRMYGMTLHGGALFTNWNLTTRIPVKFDRQGHFCNFYAGLGPARLQTKALYVPPHKTDCNQPSRCCPFAKWNMIAYVLLGSLQTGMFAYVFSSGNNCPGDWRSLVFPRF